LVEHIQNNGHDTIEIAHDLAIRHPKDAIAFIADEAIADSVTGDCPIFGMRIAIDLYDQAASVVTEVDIVASDRNLPAEVVTEWSKFAQRIPELCLWRTHSFP
jgi:hypothetical protein